MMYLIHKSCKDIFVWWESSQTYDSLPLYRKEWRYRLRIQLETTRGTVVATQIILFMSYCLSRLWLVINKNESRNEKSNVRFLKFCILNLPSNKKQKLRKMKIYKILCIRQCINVFFLLFNILTIQFIFH